MERTDIAKLYNDLQADIVKLYNDLQAMRVNSEVIQNSFPDNIETEMYERGVQYGITYVIDKLKSILEL